MLLGLLSAYADGRVVRNVTKTELTKQAATRQRKRQGLSEKQIGYLMILPALVIILVIAIWPVVRSFWISLYDVRLNDPTKSTIHSSYGIDMEKYVNTFPLLTGNVNRELGSAKTPEPVEKIKEQLEKAHQALNQDAAFVSRYKEIDQLLTEFKPIPDELKVVEVGRDEAKGFKQTIEEIESSVLDLSKKQALEKPDDVLGLVRAVKSSIIEPNYIGFRYYQDFLTDPRMWASLWNTLVFTVISVALELVLGLWIALLIHKQFVGRGLVRASILIPWAIPTVISALMWKFMYDGQNGIVAHLLEWIGMIPDMGTLLTTKAGAMFSVILADVWKTTPFMALLLFAGLQTIPQSLYEAAEVDGATKRQQFFAITLPMLKSTIMVALLFRTLDAFRVFDLIYVLTGGGPANSTETISIYAYKTMFAQMNFGAGSALSVIVFVCVALISIGYIKILGADLLGDGQGK
jgi:multiple sugar transport system permease protein